MVCNLATEICRRLLSGEWASSRDGRDGKGLWRSALCKSKRGLCLSYSSIQRLLSSACNFDIGTDPACEGAWGWSQSRDCATIWAGAWGMSCKLPADNWAVTQDTWVSNLINYYDILIEWWTGGVGSKWRGQFTKVSRPSQRATHNPHSSDS